MIIIWSFSAAPIVAQKNIGASYAAIETHAQLYTDEFLFLNMNNPQNIRLEGSNPDILVGIALENTEEEPTDCSEYRVGDIMNIDAMNQNVTATGQVVSCTLTLNPNNGNISPTSVTQAQNTTYSLPTPTRSGYTFMGWTLSGGGSLNGGVYTFGTSNGTVTAQWTANTSAKGIFGTNAKWYGAWWHYLLFFFCFGFIWMWF